MAAPTLTVTRADSADGGQAATSEAHPHRAEGKSLAEDVDVRWQMDLADLKNHMEERKSKMGEAYSALLVRIDCVARQLWAKPRKKKSQDEVRVKLSQITA